MYSRNDYRYYLERQLVTSDNYLAHYGVMGMKWGVRNDNRIAKLSDRRSKNDTKIAKYQAKLNTVSAQKRAAKASKFKAKQDKYDRKAAKARARLAKGKNISTKQMKRIIKAEQYAAKTAKYSYKNDRIQSKINKLNYKNTKLDKKISKLSKPSRAGARAYKKALNNLDKKMVRDLYTTKTSQNSDRVSKAKSRYNSNKSTTKATIKDAQKRGYDVLSKPTIRDGASYRRATANLLLGPIAGAGYSTAKLAFDKKNYGTTQYMEGTKYSVTKPKKKR